jgi:hypothetical protein
VSSQLPAVVTYFHATLCSVLWRDSTALLSLVPCCALSPACVAAVPAFGCLQRCAPPLGSLLRVQLCSAIGLGCVCVTTVAQFAPPCGGLLCLCFCAVLSHMLCCSYMHVSFTLVIHAVLFFARIRHCYSNVRCCPSTHLP